MTWAYKEDTLARDNYSYKKYQKELARKKKQEEKKQNRLAKKSAQAQEGALPSLPSDGPFA
jgi:hypothetical protein